MQRQMLRYYLTQGFMAMAALFFFQDVILDMREHLASEASYSGSDLVHLCFEMLAVAVLTLGFIDSTNYTKRLQEDHHANSSSLHYLRKDFDALVRKKFSRWQLTPAEQDVALFLLRGLPTSMIAELRNVSVGTVKVQAHTLMQKAGVTSRVELMSLFMDEFIDISTQDG